MTFSQFAFKNVTRNKRLYAAYFLSSMFTVMVFFTFAVFAFHPALSGEGMNPNAALGMSVAGGIIYVFSFFFVLYSMSSFLQSRKKDFGVLMIQGMSTRQIRLMVFMENMLIGLLAIISGVSVGLVFTKLILLIAENVLTIDVALNFYLPIYAVLLTIVSFLLLFFIISLFVSFVLRTNRLIDLIKGDKKSKTEPKASIWLTTLAVILLGIGYYIALTSEGEKVIYALIPVVLLVVVGTYFLFTQISVFVIHRLKSNKKTFWKRTNMLLFSDLSYRMKDNARAFFLVAIISTVAFSAIGTLIGFKSYLTKGVEEANPIPFVYTVIEDAEVSNDISEIEAAFEAADLETNRAIVNLKTYDIESLSKPVQIVNIKDYNQFANLAGAEELSLKADEVYVVEKSIAYITEDSIEDELIDYQIPTKGNIETNIKEKIVTQVISGFEAYYIVSEEIYGQIDLPEASATEYYAWNTTKGNEADRIEAGQIINDSIEEAFMSFVAIDYLKNEILKVYGPILFIGLFIGLIFFVSAGSFLYFRLYSDIDEDKAKFKAISKIGLTDKEMKRVVTSQTALLFFTPIIVAVIHGAVALTALSNLFFFNIVSESIMVLGSFLIIQIIYFFIVRYFYIKQIKEAL